MNDSFDFSTSDNYVCRFVLFFLLSSNLAVVFLVKLAE